MDVKLNEVITWLVIGALAGWLTGMLVRRRKEGFGRWLNLGVGLVGALIGGFLFKIFQINIGVLNKIQIQISLQEVVAGLLGSLLFLAVVWAVRRKLAQRKGTPP